MVFLHQLHILKGISIKSWIEQSTRPICPACEQSPPWFKYRQHMINNCLLFRQRFTSQSRYIYRIIPPLIQRYRLTQTGHKFTRPIKRCRKAVQ